MTALRSDATIEVRPASRTTLRAVRAGERKVAVRPDRSARILRAVPTPGSADTAPARRVVASRPVERVATVPVVARAQRAGAARAVRGAAPARSVAQQRSRMNARQRNVLAGLAVAAVAIFAFALAIFLYAALGVGPQAGAVTTVMAGDSLWSIASAMGSGLPTEQVVRDIMSLNALDGTHIEAGAQLLLPAY